MEPTFLKWHSMTWRALIINPYLGDDPPGAENARQFLERGIHQLLGRHVRLVFQVITAETAAHVAAEWFCQVDDARGVLAVEAQVGVESAF